MRAAILPTSEIYVTYLTHTLSRYVKLRVNREGENIGHFYVDLVHKALFGPRKTIGPRLVFPMSTPGENNLIKQWCSRIIICCWACSISLIPSFVVWAVLLLLLLSLIHCHINISGGARNDHLCCIGPTNRNWREVSYGTCARYPWTKQKNNTPTSSWQSPVQKDAPASTSPRLFPLYQIDIVR